MLFGIHGGRVKIQLGPDHGPLFCLCFICVTGGVLQKGRYHDVILFSGSSLSVEAQPDAASLGELARFVSSSYV